MHILVTGASGWVGSAIVPELINHGHEVTGLARSDESAAKIEAAGANVHRGSIDDLESIKAGAAAADGVIHTAYNHDFSDMPGAAATDRAVISAIGEVYAGTDKPLAFASGTAVGSVDGALTEDDRFPTDGGHPRAGNEALGLALADRGVRSMSVRLAPTVHGEGDHGFIPLAIAGARQHGVAGYIGDGSNVWNAVHRFDAARLFVAGIEAAPAGSVLHAVGDQGVAVKDIAESIARGLDIEAKSVTAEEAGEIYGFLAGFLGLDLPASSALTRERLDWQPRELGLLEDLAHDYYFESPE